MEAMEVIAVIILIVAIAVLVYYYLLNSPATMDKLRSYVPTSADSHMNEVLSTSSDYADLSKEKISEKSETTANVDSLEKDFIEFRKSSEEFQKSTEEKLNDLDKRIESLENN